MFVVEVVRTVPEVKSSWIEFDSLDKAMDYARDMSNNPCIDEVFIMDENDNGVEW